MFVLTFVIRGKDTDAMCVASEEQRYSHLLDFPYISVVTIREQYTVTYGAAAYVTRMTTGSGLDDITVPVSINSFEVYGCCIRYKKSRIRVLCGVTWSKSLRFGDDLSLTYLTRFNKI